MKPYENIQTMEADNIRIENLLESPAKLEPLTGDVGLKNRIKDRNLYRPQLALAGYLGLFNYKQVQIFGNTEFFYLQGLERKERITAFENLASFEIPCIIMTNGHSLDEDLLEIAKNNSIPVLKTNYETTKATFLITEYFDDQFAQQAVIHGSFVDVYGCGVLFVGKSGIGKSEIALDLIERGHRLVADDIVMLTKKRGVLMGTGTSMIQHFMEIRGLGIIDIRQMFGIRSIRFQKRLEVIVELEDWKGNSEYTRTGLDDSTISIMDVDIKSVKLPIFAGKNITVIAEVIALNYLLRTYGYNPAEALSSRLSNAISQPGGPSNSGKFSRPIPWFQADDE